MPPMFCEGVTSQKSSSFFWSEELEVSALTLRTINYLWDLIALSWLFHKPTEALELAKKIYDLSVDLPTSIEVMIIDLWSSKNQISVNVLGLFLAKNFIFSNERHICLVALLVEKGLLNSNEASELIFPAMNTQTVLNGPIQIILDVVWLAQQDSKEKFMQPNEDDLLKNALIDFLKL